MTPRAKITPEEREKERAYLVDLGRAVMRKRKREGLSQMELENRSAVHRNYVGGIERGERVPTIVTIRRLAEALGTTPAALFAAAEDETAKS